MACGFSENLVMKLYFVSLRILNWESFDKFALEMMTNCPVQHMQLYQIQFQLLDQLTQQKPCFPQSNQC